ncbi:SDR family oxidoreductase [Corynebacterium pseudogenitalium]|uniref:SDR family oxidoreductase n=1 Tax=Corynebacterium pseudogenitalium TaxID=38303 RepID=UPI00210C31D7|nr:SDR family oxidoreductase [Corynebacterium pseudogenitalium]
MTEAMTTKVAVVTGGSAGIGEACARALAADGWKVYVAARRVERCQAIAEEIGGVAVRLDVTDEASVAELASIIEGPVGLLVNNAGGAKGLDLLRDANPADWQWMYETNVLGTMRVTKALYPHLLEASGLVVNIGSVAATDAYKGGSGYNAAKYGLRGITRALRREEAENNIRVTEIDPGRVKTDFSLNRFAGDAERAYAVYEGKLNLTAEDIAEAVRWVASLPPHVNIDTLSIMPTDQAER